MMEEGRANVVVTYAARMSEKRDVGRRIFEPRGSGYAA